MVAVKKVIKAEAKKAAAPKKAGIKKVAPAKKTAVPKVRSRVPLHLNLFSRNANN